MWHQVCNVALPPSLFLYFSHCAVKSVWTSTVILVCFGKLFPPTLSYSGTMKQTNSSADTGQVGSSLRQQQPLGTFYMLRQWRGLCLPFSAKGKANQPFFPSSWLKAFITLFWCYLNLNLNKAEPLNLAHMMKFRTFCLRDY